MHPKLSPLLVVIANLGLTTCSAIPEAALERRQKSADGGFPFPPSENLTVVRVNDPAIGGERFVSYFKTREGEVIIDGDVWYGSDEDALLSKRVAVPQNAKLVSDQEEEQQIAQPEANKQEKRWHSVQNGQGDWPNGRLRYKFIDQATKNKAGGLVSAARTKWRYQAPWITFQELPPGPPENGVVSITSTPCGGCWSGVGYRNGIHKMNLMVDVCDGGVCGVDQAVHEFGHALGFNHEHQRQDRNSFVHYDCAALDPQCSNLPSYYSCCLAGVSLLYPNCCKAAPNFERITSGQVFSGAYDAFSIMHYTRRAFARPDKNTLNGVGSIVVPYGTTSTLSQYDKQRACSLYQGTCNLYNTCKAKDCPATCQIQQPCQNPKCGDDFEPACCSGDTDANAACNAKKAACKAAGCDLFIN